MEKTTVIFVRHAQSLHPYSDDRTRPLTDEGMIDRQLVLETLKDRHIDAFLSSPYQRSIDTIITTADFFCMNIKTDERFRERKAGTDASGMLERRWADFSFAEEGGENLESVQKRNIEALKDVLDLYKGKTVVIGTHGTALSCILNYYDRSFGVNDFLRIVNWMPYIVELIFDGESLTEKKELAHVEKAYQNIDFSVITACGECCTRCTKKVAGECPGCIEADGVVPEWAGSGRCRIHKCARDHGVQFCGLCKEFPCELIPDMIPWNPDIISHLTYLKDEYERENRLNMSRTDMLDHIKLEEVREDELQILHEMQVKSFMPLYKKYHDEGSPAIESIERIRARAARPNRKYYFIIMDGTRVGAINLGHNDPDEKKVSFISPIFICPEFWDRGIGYAAIQKAFEMYSEVKIWKLETILQEGRNCHLYEKCGFVRVGDEKPVNENMTLIDYELRII